MGGGEGGAYFKFWLIGGRLFEGGANLRILVKVKNIVFRQLTVNKFGQLVFNSLLWMAIDG